MSTDVPRSAHGPHHPRPPGAHRRRHGDPRSTPGPVLRRRLPRLPSAADPPVLFPSPKGLLRDPNNTKRRPAPGPRPVTFPWATSHTSRRTGATHLDEAGPSARQIADHLGRSRPSLTQDVYLGRGTASPLTAAALERSV